MLELAAIRRAQQEWRDRKRRELELKAQKKAGRRMSDEGSAVAGVSANVSGDGIDDIAASESFGNMNTTGSFSPSITTPGVTHLQAFSQQQTHPQAHLHAHSQTFSVQTTAETTALLTPQAAAAFAQVQAQARAQVQAQAQAQAHARAHAQAQAHAQGQALPGAVSPASQSFLHDAHLTSSGPISQSSQMMAVMMPSTHGPGVSRAPFESHLRRHLQTYTPVVPSSLQANSLSPAAIATPSGLHPPPMARSVVPGQLPDAANAGHTSEMPNVQAHLHMPTHYPQDEYVQARFAQLEAQRQWRENKRREIALKRAKSVGSRRGRKKQRVDAGSSVGTACLGSLDGIIVPGIVGDASAIPKVDTGMTGLNIEKGTSEIPSSPSAGNITVNGEMLADQSALIRREGKDASHTEIPSSGSVDTGQPNPTTHQTGNSQTEVQKDDDLGSAESDADATCTDNQANAKSQHNVAHPEQPPSVGASSNEVEGVGPSAGTTEAAADDETRDEEEMGHVAVGGEVEAEIETEVVTVKDAEVSDLMQHGQENEEIEHAQVGHDILEDHTTSDVLAEQDIHVDEVSDAIANATQTLESDVRDIGDVSPDDIVGDHPAIGDLEVNDGVDGTTEGEAEEAGAETTGIDHAPAMIETKARGEGAAKVIGVEERQRRGKVLGDSINKSVKPVAADDTTSIENVPRMEREAEEKAKSKEVEVEFEAGHEEKSFPLKCVDSDEPVPGADEAPDVITDELNIEASVEEVGESVDKDTVWSVEGGKVVES